ncbi:MAG: prepilin peptidase [Lachnospiraceae bacterium]|nr:prepilin peptidase [Lachnospiraceae bacterium]
MQTLIPLYIFVFLYGIVIGSFVNVCIYRIPLGEDIVKTSSHCMKCGHILKWYDLFPVFSFLALKGKCRYCGVKLSIQYPVIEVINGILYCLIVGVKGVNMNSIIYCLFASALLTLSVIDFRILEIPIGINYCILVLGLIHLGLNYQKFWNYSLGFLSVSAGLFVLYQVTKGKGIGGGDIKLMAVSGLLLGVKANILAFLLACILGSIIHSIRMKITKADHVLALGPYLAAGILIALLWGEGMIAWYMNLFF